MQSELFRLTKEYQEVSEKYINLEKHNQYLISHHSTAIEGNTLTILETEIFLEKGLTASGKPLAHHMMVKNHFEALQFVTHYAKSKRNISIDLIKQINAHIMKDTGTIHNTVLGSFDESKGDLRLLNVRAGLSGESYMSFDKVEKNLKTLVTDLNAKLEIVNSVEEINELAFLAHYQLVTIHPFSDGNGRTSRLLMNYIQSFHGVPLSIVFEQNRHAYIQSLIDTRKSEDIQIFLNFMNKEHIQFLQEEIKTMAEEQKPKTKNINKINLIF